MSTSVEATSTASSPSRFCTFALVFGIAFAVLYVVCDMAKLPMFTYHPGTDRIDWGYAAARRDEGPAMYWYGWLATSALGAATLGGLIAWLPALMRSKIPLTLAWVVPLVLMPILLYSLKFYWRWE